MIVAKQVFENMINSPVRSFRGRVEIYKGSTPALICGCRDRLKSFKIERAGERGKFFGFGICQKLEAHLLDRDRELNITKDNTLEIEFGVDVDFVYPYPNFYVSEVKRDENTNELTIIAYDALYRAKEHTVSELELTYPYTVKEFMQACATLLGVPSRIENVTDSSFELICGDTEDTLVNFDGTESIRKALDAIAEITQTVYYINHNWELTFKRLDKNNGPVAVIDKTKYKQLESKTSHTLTSIVSVTELGENIDASLEERGAAQYIRDNPFLELRARTDVASILDKALAAVGDLTIYQIDCDWRGNFLLEIGDKIALTTKDDNTITSYILDDTMSFNGALSGKTSWSYENNNGETPSNPTSLGVALNTTFARVDKLNNEIKLVSSRSEANSNSIAALQINTNSISASVKAVETKTDNSIGELEEEISTITKTVNTKLDANGAQLLIETELSNGVDKVKTRTTGYTFDDNGLSISKSDSEISTTITEDGMKVFKGDAEALVADNQGVRAKDLRATTYLIVGTHSRFEDTNNGRTACFWIGE